MNIDLREAVSDNFGFGDFIFRDPHTMKEVARIHNLKELQNVIFAIPCRIFPLSYQPQPYFALAVFAPSSR